jgi:hypothetical protein
LKLLDRDRAARRLSAFSRWRKTEASSVPKQPASALWLKLNAGAIGPPAAHAAAAVGMLAALGLVYALGSIGTLSRPWGVVLTLAGYAVPFAIAREWLARRGHPSSDLRG